MEGPCRRYGWCCNPIGHQPNYTHIPNEKAWNLREAVFLKSVCAAPGDHLVGALCRIVGFSLKCDLGTSPPGRDVFFLRIFNPQIGYRDVEQLLCQDSSSGPAWLEVRKIAAESTRFLVSAW